MAKDFANRKTKTAARGATSQARSQAGSQAGKTRGKKSPSAPARNRKRAEPSQKKKKPVHRTAFHGPSFSGGIVLGGLLVLAAANVPEVFREQVQQTLAAKTLEAGERVQFEFPERLRESEVDTDSDAYANDANPASDKEMEYLIQAASFQAMDDAESLRAQLILIDLPVRTNAVRVGDMPWYRVTVGPFLSQVQAGRAMTRLRQLNLDAFLIKRER
jgi:cell division protein FtsN